MTSSLLNSANLASAHENTVKPLYTPSEHASGIVHIGIGAFHKAHQAVFTDDVLNSCGGDWRITAVSLRRPTARDQLEKQDSLYTVVEKSDNGAQYRVIGAVEKVLVCPEAPEQVVEALASENIKIVTLTVTEKGYCQKDNALDEKHPEILHDLAQLSSGNKNLSIKTMPGLVVAACAARMQTGRQGFTVVSCDNLPHNGKITQNVISTFAHQVDANLAAWIEKNVSFCSTMVDRIVPATTPQALIEVEAAIGLKDDAAVICEPFRQWVIEDNFIAGRPKWEEAGALLVKDVSLYEDMKLRLLNGSHSALAYLGFLAGFTFIHEAINNTTLHQLVKTLMDEDVTPSLQVPEGFDLTTYKEIIRERFANSEVPYKTTQVANDGSQKLPQRLLAVAQHHVTQGQQPKAVPLIVAAWFHFLEGQNAQGDRHEVNDPLAGKLCSLALSLRNNEKQQVKELVEASQIFPETLAGNAEFVAAITHHLKSIHARGILQSVAEVAE